MTTKKPFKATDKRRSGVGDNQPTKVKTKSEGGRTTPASTAHRHKSDTAKAGAHTKAGHGSRAETNARKS